MLHAQVSVCLSVCLGRAADHGVCFKHDSNHTQFPLPNKHTASPLQTEPLMLCRKVM